MVNDARETSTGRETLSQWQLVRRRFAKHRLALISLDVLVVLYVVALFAEFFAPHSTAWGRLEYAYAPPQQIRFGFSKGLYTYGLTQHVDPITFRKSYTENLDQPVPLSFFAKGDPYRLFRAIPWDRHFLGIDWAEYASLQPAGSHPDSQTLPTFYLLGADKYGRDVLSRIIHGARISLSVGLIGVAVTFVLGIVIGGISGYVGGTVDNLIQRGMEILRSFPALPLWMSLGAAMPAEWSPLRVYFAITVLLSLLGWTDLARVVRGKILSLREEDYATAARLMGAGRRRVLFRHLLPGFTSHIIVALTLSVPGMILGETALTFLGLGLRPPVVSWGVMLRDCMHMQTVANYPWLLMPVVFVVLLVLSYNFVGDGMRDAADPYSAR